LGFPMCAEDDQHKREVVAAIEAQLAKATAQAAATAA